MANIEKPKMSLYSFLIAAPSLIGSIYMFSISGDAAFTEVQWALWALFGAGGLFGLVCGAAGLVRN